MACMFDVLLQDLRYGVRTLAKTPAFTAVAVISLALGIGVNIAIFGFLDAALFKPLAADHPGELVSLYHRSDKGGDALFSTSYPEYEFYRDRNSVFSGMLAYLRLPMVVGSGAAAAQISGELVSPSYFNTLGIRPAAGRFFIDGERDAVAVISYQLWRDRFGGDPAAVGKTLQIGAGKFTVIGVAPQAFRGIVMDWADPPEIWAPVDRYKEAAPVFPIDIVHAWGMESYLVTARTAAWHHRGSGQRADRGIDRPFARAAGPPAGSVRGAVSGAASALLAQQSGLDCDVSESVDDHRRGHPANRLL
jgi:hypothetical protein